MLVASASMQMLALPLYRAERHRCRYKCMVLSHDRMVMHQARHWMPPYPLRSLGDACCIRIHADVSITAVPSGTAPLSIQVHGTVSRPYGDAPSAALDASVSSPFSGGCSLRPHPCRC